MRILYIDIDALTPSHLGCYGYHRRTSPTIDAIAAQGVRFSNVYCSDAPCLPSRTALYSGRFGFQTGVVGHGGTAAQPRVEGKYRGFRDAFDSQGLATQFQRQGMHTAMISPFGQRHAAHWFYAGFNEIHNTGQWGLESAEVVQPVVEDWLSRHAASDNWYLHVNYWDAHTPYRAPMSYGNPFDRDAIEPWYTPELLAKHVAKAGPHSAQDVGMYTGGADPKFPRMPDRITDMASLKQWIDGYDTGIRYVDDQIAQIVEALKTAGVYDQTAIVISADHGENQGELGIYGEHATADQATCRIPLIIRWPGGACGHVDEKLHYQLDLAPTYMELTGGQPQPIWDGQSFAGSVKGGGLSGRQSLVVGQCAHVCQRSVRADNWLYIRTYHDGFHLFPQEMLFDVTRDPHELHDLASTQPEICDRLAHQLLDWQDQQMRKLADASDAAPVDPLWTVIAEGGPYHALHDPARSPLPKYVQRLRETGRAEGAQWLIEKYPMAAGIGKR